ncbi:hypothetical protein BKI52_01375 [marine bacterium AO1-C]|nr:hypothetical protein BKI52_01375 [marine bacterium AO1-C]
MATTKDKILATALQLFNEQGSEQVSTRHIAEAMGKSVGNLYYHFEDKNAIIIRLYEQLVEKLNVGFDQMQAIDVNLEIMMQAVKFTFSTLYEYRFLMINFVHIMRSIPVLKQSYQALTQVRKAQFRYTFDQLIVQGMVKKEALEVPFEYLQLQSTILGDFWISEAEILYQGEEKDKVKYFTEMQLYNFYPHLTDAGKTVFKNSITSLFDS